MDAKIILKYKKAFSLIVLVLIFLYIFLGVDYKRLFEMFSLLNWWVILTLFLINVVSILIQGGRWWYTLAIVNEKVGFFGVMKIHLVSNFYSIILPSGSAIDFTRGYLISRQIGASKSIAAGWVTKVQSLIVMLFCSTVGLILLKSNFLGVYRSWMLYAVLMILFVLIWCSMSVTFFGVIQRCVPSKWLKFKTLISGYIESLSKYNHNRRHFFISYLLAFVSQLVSIVGVLFLIYFVTEEWFLLNVLIVVPIVELLSSIQPFAPNGLGFREGLLLAFLKSLNIEHTQIAMILFLSLLMNLVRLIGAPFVLIDFLKKTKEVKKEHDTV